MANNDTAITTWNYSGYTYVHIMQDLVGERYLVVNHSINLNTWEGGEEYWVTSQSVIRPADPILKGRMLPLIDCKRVMDLIEKLTGKKIERKILAIKHLRSLEDGSYENFDTYVKEYVSAQKYARAGFSKNAPGSWVFDGETFTAHEVEKLTALINDLRPWTRVETL